MQAVATGKVLNLIVNLPPRFGKSALACIAFPAWVLQEILGQHFYLHQFLKA